MPAITAARYSCGRLVAYALMTQASPAHTAPHATTGRGPILSTSQPSSGTSQVSVTMKMEKATWMADSPQWCLAFIGVTNNVQPYCRLATSPMQTTPIASWNQRL